MTSTSTGPFGPIGAKLQTLPRETRDTLFLLAVVAWIILLQTPNIPVWTSVVSLGAVVWRARTTWLGQPLPRWPLRVAWLIAALAGTAMHYHTLLGKDPGVAMVIALLALKNLEMRARRDAFVLFFLGFFALLTHLFYSQSLLSAAGTVVGLMGLLTGLVNAHMTAGRPRLKTSAGIASKLVLLGTPVMVTLFVLFPRVDPLWSMPSDEKRGKTGLSDALEVGDITSLALSEEIAFRVRFDGDRPPGSAMYFRGPVMSEFDGRRWEIETRRLGAADSQSPTFETDGPAIAYEVLLEGNGFPWVLTLDLATQAPTGLRQTPRLLPSAQWSLRRPINAVVRYRAQSHLQYRLEADLSDSELVRFKRLPPGSNPRTVELARELRATFGQSDTSDEQILSAILERLRQGGYSYTLEPGLYGQHAADQFWFDTKAGFCEHIASSFVVLARASGIPARIVTGYLGGTLNAVDGEWVVRQDSAHAWAEVWLNGRGWVRYDPTGAVSPDRLGQSGSIGRPTTGFSGTVANINPTLGAYLRNVWDAVDGTWKRLVVDYTQDEQINLLKALGFQSPSWFDLGYLLAGLVVVGASLAGGWTLWEKRNEDPWLRLLRMAQQRMAAAHLIEASATLHTPRQLRKRLQASELDPGFEKDISNWLMRMEHLRYAKGSRDTLGTLKARLSQLRWPT